LPRFRYEAFRKSFCIDRLEIRNQEEEVVLHILPRERLETPEQWIRLVTVGFSPPRDGC